MDENNNNQPNQQNPGQAPQEPGTAPILDVQPPRQEGVVAAPPAQDKPANEQQTAENTDAAKTSVDNTENAAANTAVPDPVHQPELTAPKKHKTPVLVIVVAVLIAAALAIFTVLAFTQQDKTTTKQQPANGTAQQPAEAVTPESVDQTADEIDKTINELDAASDFPENELSDSNLGL